MPPQLYISHTPTSRVAEMKSAIIWNLMRSRTKPSENMIY